MIRMIRPTLGLLVLLAAAALFAPAGSALEIRVRSVEPAATPRYGLCEITLDIPGTWANPYDPDEIEVSARFVSPSGKTIRVRGFFYQPFRDRTTDDSKRPLLDEAGPACWKVRFTPIEIGAYSAVVEARGHGAGRAATSQPLPVRCVDSPNHGFIHVEARNGRYFQFDDGTPFFPVGQNLQNDWPIYKHSRLLAAGGANAARVWTFCHWTWLEWSPKAESSKARPGDWMRDYAGAGRYNQRIAWIADHHLAQWTRDGLRLMFCLGTEAGEGEVRNGGGYEGWGGHPYNRANGGFLDRPEQFWTDPRAKKLYQQRLRYLVARYAYSPNLWAWELWNELGEATPEIVAWHKEMAGYLHEIDPYRHLVTTSTWEQDAGQFAAVWDLKDLDFTQSHIYQPLPAMPWRIGDHLARWARPHLVGEGGGAGDGDPQGTDFHNALWAPVALGAAGTTLSWWWRERIEPQNLFFHYRAVAAFVADVPWTECSFQPAVTGRASLRHATRPEFSPVLVVPLGGAWGRRAPRDQFEVEPDGHVPHLSELGASLFGSSHKSWRNPPTLDVVFPQAGRLIIHVARASHSVLAIDVDGRRVLRDASFDQPKSDFEKDVAVNIPAGRHQIRLDNAGRDSLTIRHLLLTNYRDPELHPDLDVFGLTSDRLSFLWIHNRLHQADFQAAGVAAGSIGPGTIALQGLHDGAYDVQWWDTCQGRAMTNDAATCAGGRLELHLPVVATDVACKIRPR